MSTITSDYTTAKEKEREREKKRPKKKKRRGNKSRINTRSQSFPSPVLMCYSGQGTDESTKTLQRTTCLYFPADLAQPGVEGISLERPDLPETYVTLLI